METERKEAAAGCLVLEDGRKAHNVMDAFRRLREFTGE